MTEAERAHAEREALLARALDRLDEALARDVLADALVLDATIQRFEFCVELCWRALKAALRVQGIEANSPRAAFRAAYQQGWIGDEALWLAMVEDRNLTSHTYRREVALDILARIPRYRDAMRAIVPAP